MNSWTEKFVPLLKRQKGVLPRQAMFLDYFSPLKVYKDVTPYPSSLHALEEHACVNVVAEVAPDEQQEMDKMYEVFIKLAGEDEEVDWKELKEILDYAMRDGKELARSDGVYYKKDMNTVNAEPKTTSSDANQLQNDSFTRQLLSLICGHFCRDLSAEVIPKPVERAPLSTSLAELTKDGFSKDICRSMIAMMDMDRSGKLGYEEFKTLWLSLQEWKNVWTQYDIDKSGTFSGFELRDAMQSAGYRLNNRVLNALMHRYGTKHGEVQFDDFIMCAIKTKTMIDMFKTKDITGTNTATFSMEEWLENTLHI